jgi:uncharacterized protein
MLTKQASEFIVELTKSAIVSFLEEKEVLKVPEEYPEELSENRGVFVTLYQYDSQHEHLRGCMGLPYPSQALVSGIIDAAALACTDMRFVPLKAEDIPEICFELSVLTKPELIEVNSSEEYLKVIKPKEDGLILKLHGNSGLFLPVVWNEIETTEGFLEALSHKAGLSSEAWKDEEVKMYRFSTQVLTGKMKE